MCIRCENCLKSKSTKSLRSNHFLGYSSGSATSRASNVSSSSSNAVDNKHHHNHNCSTNGCLGAIPRNPSYSSMHFRGRSSHSFRVRILKQYLWKSTEFFILYQTSRIEFQICQIVCHPSKSTLWEVQRDIERRRLSIREFFSSKKILQTLIQAVCLIFH